MFPHQILIKVWPPPAKDSMGNKELSVTTLGEDLIELIILECPRLRMPFSPFLNLHTSLIMRIVILRIPSPYVLMTVLMTLNLRIPYMSSHSPPSIEDNVLRIGDCDPFEMSSHDDDSVPNLSECNLFDDNSSSPTDRFQDVIELSQCKIFDSPLAKDFVLTLGECNIFDGSPIR